MRRLPFAGKVALIAAALLLPLSICAAGLAQSARGQLAFTGKERLGVRMMAPLDALAGALIAEPQPSGAPEPPLVAEVDAADRQVGPALGTSSSWQRTRPVVLAALQTGHREQALKLVQELLGEVADRSNLILDPELPSYYLMIAAAQDVPELVTATAVGSPAVREQARRRVLDDLRKTRSATDDARLRAAADEMATGFASDESGPFRQAVAGFAATAGPHLDAMLVRREHQLRADRNQPLILTGLGLLVALYLLGASSAALRGELTTLEELSAQDPLTGLGNHRVFHERLQRAVQHAGCTSAPLCLALIDVDDFKFVNDIQGHRSGDRLLRQVAELLRRVRTQDDAFRIGGDEFAVIVPGEDLDGARRLLEQLRSEAAHVLMGTTLSIGLALLSDADNANELWEQADAALYEAKRRGRDRIVLHDELLTHAATSLAKGRALRSLLEAGEVDVAFQPIWNLERSCVYGFEALLRLPVGCGLADPSEAFEVARAAGRAHELDALARRTALRAARALPAEARLFLNLHPETLERHALPGDALLHEIAGAGIDPGRVVLELTEQIPTLVDEVCAEATRLRELGLQLALDDVGAGNAGLGMLRQLPVDIIKIDSNLVRSAEDEESARAVLVAVLAFARQTDAFVIAEGIEHSATLRFLDELALHTSTQTSRLVHAAQGFLLGRPAPADSAAAAVEEAPAAVVVPAQAAPAELLHGAS